MATDEATRLFLEADAARQKARTSPSKERVKQAEDAQREFDEYSDQAKKYPSGYRKPSEKEAARLEESRRLMQQGIEDEKSVMSRLMPTMAKSARDDIRAAKALRESVPQSVREYEAYKDAGYKRGGVVSSASSRADGCAKRGKTKGKMV